MKPKDWDECAPRPRVVFEESLWVQVGYIRGYFHHQTVLSKSLGLVPHSLTCRLFLKKDNEEYLLDFWVGYISVGDWCSGCICHYSLATWESCWHCPHIHRKRKPRMFPSQRRKSNDGETLGRDQIQMGPDHKEKAAALQEMKDYDIYIWPKKNPPAGQPGKSFPDYYEESL